MMRSTLPAIGLGSRRWAVGWGVAALAAMVGGCAAQPTATAPSYEAQLAQHLAATGSVMYGAHWCPHCADQKALFGQAADQVLYVECAADGKNAQPHLCQQKAIAGYPTWEIDGQLYPGVQTLSELATLSGFGAPQ